MEKQSLQKLIRGANKKVGEGGGELLQAAKDAGREGTVEAFSGILRNYRDLFDDDFEEKLPSLQKHLESRDEENLQAMCQIVDQRLSFLAKAAGINEEESEDVGVEEESGESAEVVEEAVPSEDPVSDEDDFAALLEQKSVDEMDESEMAAITISEKIGEDGASEEVPEELEEEPEPLIEDAGPGQMI